MDNKEKQEHIRLLKKKYANTYYWPIAGLNSRYFYFDTVKITEEITKKCKQYYLE